MGTMGLKTELQKMIEQENDINILKAIKTLLQKAALNPELKEKLSYRSLKSEEDIREGRVMSKEELINRTNKYFSI